MKKYFTKITIKYELLKIWRDLYESKREYKTTDKNEFLGGL